MDDSAWIAIGVALIAASPGIYLAYVQRKRDKLETPVKIADAAERLTGVALKLIEPLQVELKEKNEENAKLRRQLSDCTRKLEKSRPLKPKEGS